MSVEGRPEPDIVAGAAWPRPPRSRVVLSLGITQILGWGSTFYLPAVLAPVIADDTGWPVPAIVGGLTLGLLIAGAVSPLVGRLIDRHGGRPVLCAASLLFAAGLAVLAMARGLPLYLAAWAVLGLAMGAGLYDAAFATLGRIYREDARQAITLLTLIAGFASTVCWPLTAWLAAMVGWRGTCLSYAALQLAVALPLHASALPRLPSGPTDAPHPSAQAGMSAAAPAQVRLYLLLAATITLAAAITAIVAVQLIAILQERGFGLVAAVGLAAFIGPAQVAARAIEMLLARRQHPIWTMIAATLLLAIGIALLTFGFPVPAVALVCFGAGAGLHSIARGSVPLALFGPTGYATLMGRLARPNLLAQAVAPVLAALILQRAGADATLLVLCALALADLALAILLAASVRASYAPVTRQITSPTSSATSSDPSGPTATPTGRP
ncbi:MAG: MFS transporter [Geminicoccaceae bacterium]